MTQYEREDLRWHSAETEWHMLSKAVLHANLTAREYGGVRDISLAVSVLLHEEAWYGAGFMQVSLSVSKFRCIHTPQY